MLDVLVIDKKQKASLGAPIFEIEEELASRRVFEYASDAVMNLKWLEAKQMIIFDNLEPTQQNLKMFNNCRMSFVCLSVKGQRGSTVKNHPSTKV